MFQSQTKEMPAIRDDVQDLQKQSLLRCLIWKARWDAILEAWAT